MNSVERGRKIISICISRERERELLNYRRKHAAIREISLTVRVVLVDIVQEGPDKGQSADGLISPSSFVSTTGSGGHRFSDRAKFNYAALYITGVRPGERRTRTRLTWNTMAVNCPWVQCQAASHNFARGKRRRRRRRRRKIQQHRLV